VISRGRARIVAPHGRRSGLSRYRTRPPTAGCFDRIAYLAQSPQFYKEHGVAAFERVFETGHVYRAEPHASSHHLTEYYSLDLEMGFIDGPEDVIHLEKKLLTRIFQQLNQHQGDLLLQYRPRPLPFLLEAPVWEFGDCLDMLARNHGTSHLKDDLDPLDLCPALAPPDIQSVGRVRRGEWPGSDLIRRPIPLG
jgi:aspartyl/asparaginyl-tRNA synthetase